MLIHRGLVIGAALFLAACGRAGAVCPALQTDCPSPTYNSVTANSIQTNNSSAAALTVDLAGITGKLNGTLSAAQIFQNIVHQPTSFNADGVRGVAVAEPGSTVTNTNGIAGYVFNQTPNLGSGGPNSVSIYGVGISGVNSAETWGINTNLTDSVNTGVTSGTGIALLNELDFNVSSPNTVINGLVLQGASVSQPASANGFVVSPLRLGFYDRIWNNSFMSNNGAATIAMFVGTLGNPSGANLPSQSIAFINTNGAAAQQVTTMSTSTTGLGISGPGVTANTVTLTPGTVAALVAANTCNTAHKGMLASVSDATAVAYNGTLTGGGSLSALVFCNGTNWLVH